jgi:hypothetical protein
MSGLSYQWALRGLGLNVRLWLLADVQGTGLYVCLWAESRHPGGMSAFQAISSGISPKADIEGATPWSAPIWVDS